MKSSVDDIKNAIKELAISDVSALLQWLDDYQEAMWDKQLEEDVAAGRLDKVGAEALEEDHAGKTQPL
ncbi:MAG: hypothetical protein WD873_02330 [Candidatus Hydrogenedentales bacterium]